MAKRFAKISTVTGLLNKTLVVVVYPSPLIMTDFLLRSIRTLIMHSYLTLTCLHTCFVYLFTHSFDPNAGFNY